MSKKSKITLRDLKQSKLAAAQAEVKAAGALAAAIENIQRRLAVVEQRAGIAGPAGPKGERGEKGETGKKGGFHFLS